MTSCVYEVQWFSDAPLTVMVGSATVTPSEYEIAGLTRGSQYWIRVRTVRAGQVGPLSDQATRVANILKMLTFLEIKLNRLEIS